MQAFSKLKGVEGIDILCECVPYVDEILSDRSIFTEAEGMTWLEAAGPIYKKHQSAFDSIFELLEMVPTTSAQIVASTACVMSEIHQNEETRSFFMGTCKNARSTIRAMVNTEEERSTGS